MLRQEIVDTIPCILCGQLNTRVVSKNAQSHGLPITVVICKNDGLVYLNPRWTPARYREFYASEYDRYYRQENDDARVRLGYIHGEKIWNRLQSIRHKSISTILDIGAGMGYTLEYIAGKAGDSVSLAAIEASGQCINHLAEKLGVELVAKNAETEWHKNIGKRFDLVIMRHVLEHFLDPIAILHKVGNVLSPEGMVYIEVPDMMKPRGSLDTYWFRVSHTYYFSDETLQMTVARAGLQPVVLQSDDSDLWGFFTRPESEQPIRYSSVYDRQQAVLNRYRKNRSIMLIAGFLPRIICRILPAPVKNCVPEHVRKKIGDILLL